jgi:hypothetical protein
MSYATTCLLRAPVVGVGIGEPEVHTPTPWTRRQDEEAKRDAAIGPDHPRYGREMWHRYCTEEGCSWEQWSPRPRIVDADHPEDEGGGGGGASPTPFGGPPWNAENLIALDAEVRSRSRHVRRRGVRGAHTKEMQALARATGAMMSGISLVRDTSGTANASTQTLTLSSNPTAGDLLVVQVGANDSITSISASSTYTSAVVQSSSLTVVSIWYAQNCVGGAGDKDPTINFSSSSSYEGSYLEEYSGVATSSALDQTSSSASLTPGSITPAGSGELFTAVATLNGTVSAPSGWNDFGETSPSFNVDAAYLVNSGSGAENPTFGGSGSGAYEASAMATFKPAPVSSLPHVPTVVQQAAWIASTY